MVKTSSFQIVSCYSVIGLYDVFHRSLIVYTLEYLLIVFRNTIAKGISPKDWFKLGFCMLLHDCMILPLPHHSLISFLFLAVHLCFKVIRVFFGFS